MSIVLTGVLPGPAPGSGLKLRDPVAFLPLESVLPGPAPGSGLKLASAGGRFKDVGVLPGPAPGSGLKLLQVRVLRRARRWGRHARQISGKPTPTGGRRFDPQAPVERSSASAAIASRAASRG